MANEKKQPIKMVTPEGIAMWAKVNTEFDDYKGQRKYKLRLELPEKDEKKLIADLQKLYKDAQESPEHKDKEWRHKPRLGFKPDKKSGKIQFSFQTNAFYKDKAGVEQRKAIPIFDKYGQRIDEKEIRNGSKIKVSFSPDVYYESEDSNGITLYLRQIVVIEAVEYSGNADFEFEQFSPEDNDDDPFAD